MFSLSRPSARRIEQFVASQARRPLFGAGGWVFLSRLGARPFGFSHEIIQLTAVHLHYVGFVLPLLAGLAGRGKAGRLTNLVCAGTILAFPVVAGGMTLTQVTTRSTLELVGVFVLAATCVGLAALQCQAALRTRHPVVLALLCVSALSLLCGMALAAAYSIGQASGHAWLDIPVMLPTHGLLQAFGFAFCGLLGWQIAQRRAGGTLVSGGFGG